MQATRETKYARDERYDLTAIAAELAWIRTSGFTTHDRARRLMSRFASLSHAWDGIPEAFAHLHASKMTGDVVRASSVDRVLYRLARRTRTTSALALVLDCAAMHVADARDVENRAFTGREMRKAV